MRGPCWRLVGTILAFSALLAFILHPDHLLLESGSHTRAHCSVCHTVPMGASVPSVEQAPGAFLRSDVVIPEPPRLFQLSFALDTPRGPPAA